MMGNESRLPERSPQTLIELLELWMEEDSRVDSGLEAWEELKQALDRSRPAEELQNEVYPRTAHD